MENKKFEKHNYNVLDASKNFFYVLFMPYVVMIALEIAIAFMAVFSGQEYKDISSGKIITFIMLFFSHAVFLGVYIYYNKKHKINYKNASSISNRIQPTKTLVVILISLISVFLISHFIGLLDYLYTLFGYNPDVDLPIKLDSFGNFIIASIAFAIIPAVVEELIFRGVILGGLRSKMSSHLAVWLSAIMFMLMHGALQQTVYQLILGVVFGYVTLYTGNIIYSMILHFFNNFIVLVYSYAYYGTSSVLVMYNTAIDVILPIALLILGLILIYVLIQFLKFGEFKLVWKHITSHFTKSKKALLFGHKNKSNKKVNKSERKNIIVINDAMTNTSVIVPLKKQKLFKNFTHQEKVYFFGGIILGVALWLYATLIVIFK